MSRTPLLPVLCTTAAMTVGLPVLFGGGPPVEYFGMCDASAAIALDGGRVVVADDEDNILRTYDRARGGFPGEQVDLGPFLSGGRKSSETDIEASARVGNRIFWISSHGRNARGKPQPNRQRFFATLVGTGSGRPVLVPAGVPSTRLLEQLSRDPRVAGFGLQQAARKAPKTEGALNIEGLAATPEGHLLLGFRNPVPKGLALVVPLLNPVAVLEGRHAEFGEPLRLDLGGRGIRSMEFWRGRYYIAAGSWDGGGNLRLFVWAGGAEAPRELRHDALRGLNLEAMAFYTEGGRDWLFAASDDGTRQIDGCECKRLEDVGQKRFRAVAVALDVLQEPDSTPLGRSVTRGVSTAGIARP